MSASSEVAMSSVAASPKAKAKARVRGKAIARPKLDLDKEIQEANLLATMSRKLMTAARSIERNNKKSKSRLIRKAGKLSPEDLERLAVLKRCGLYADDAPGAADADGASTGDDQSTRAAEGSSRLEPKKQKLAELLDGNPSAQAFLDGVRGAFPSLTKAGTGRSLADIEISENAGSSCPVASSDAVAGVASNVE